MTHKFQADAGMTFEEVFGFTVKEWLVPILQGLAEEVQGHDFIETLKRAGARVGSQRGRDAAKGVPTNDFAAYTALIREQLSDRLVEHALSLEVVEDTDEALEIKVTECLWAKTFRESGAPDLGYATLCHPDFAFPQAFNPKIRMTRTKTLMQGDDCCNHRWVLEE